MYMGRFLTEGRVTHHHYNRTHCMKYMHKTNYLSINRQGINFKYYEIQLSRRSKSEQQFLF